MKTLLQILLLITIQCTALSARTIEVKHFSEIFNHVSVGTTVILDIDDTLLIPEQMLGCDEWFLARMKERIQNNVPQPQAFEKTLAEFEAIRHLTTMNIVEPGSEIIVKELQQMGTMIMGLTTQGLGMATRTVHQLIANDIDLSLTAPTKEDFYVNVKGHGVLFRKGILFTSGTNKGNAFFTFCDNFGIAPKRIVFINDKATHLREIEAAAEERGVEFIGLRYAYADIHKALYNQEIADIQFNHSNFGHILSNEEALQIK